MQQPIREYLRKLLIQQNSTLSFESDGGGGGSTANAHLYYDDELMLTRPLLSTAAASSTQSLEKSSPTNVYGIAEVNPCKFAAKMLPKQFCGFSGTLEKRIKISECYSTIDPLLCCSCTEFYALMMNAGSCDGDGDNDDIFMRYRNKLPIIVLNVARLVWTFETFRHRLESNEAYDEERIMRLSVDFYLATDYKYLVKNNCRPNLNFSNYLHKLRSNGYFEYAMDLAMKNFLDVDYISYELFRERSEMVGGSSGRDIDDPEHCDTSRLVEFLSDSINTSMSREVCPNDQYFISRQVGQEIDNTTHYNYRLKDQTYYGVRYALKTSNSINVANVKRSVLTVIENGVEWYVKVTASSVIF